MDGVRELRSATDLHGSTLIDSKARLRRAFLFSSLRFFFQQPFSLIDAALLFCVPLPRRNTRSAAHVLLLEYLRDTGHEALTVWRVKPHQQDSAMRSRSELSNIRKVQSWVIRNRVFLRDACQTSRSLYSAQVLVGDSVNIVAEVSKDCDQTHRKGFRRA